MKKHLSLLFLTFLIMFGTVSHVDAAWDDKQKAVVVYGQSPQDYGQGAFLDVVDEAKSVGANTVSLTIDWYQESASSSVFYRGKNTPRDDMLIDGIRYIKSQDLDVYLLIRAETSEWRAEIDPTNRAQWFENYGEILNKYAEIGAQEGVDGLSLGTEMYKITSIVYNAQNEAGWAAMISDVKNRFDGKLTYSAQHSGDKSDLFEVNFWDQMDFVGISAYYYLSDNLDDDLTKSLEQSWAQIDQDYVKKAHDLYGKQVVFTELGYRNMENSYRDPWFSGPNRGNNESHQVAAYSALLNYWQDVPYFDGWHIWTYEANNARLPKGNTNFSPQGKDAEATLAQFWGGQVPDRSGYTTEVGDTVQCVDTPPLRDNKGWDETIGNCHVNGEKWVPGISDQPGYKIGDTAIQDPEPSEPEERENTDPVVACYDAAPRGDNKGWDGTGNCHVNGEKWVPGISDQPGYQAGDTVGLEITETPTETEAQTEVEQPETPVVALSCYDAPPLNDNKGWDGTGNCHVNGEPWIFGISDQPGYKVGDTLNLVPEQSPESTPEPTPEITPEPTPEPTPTPEVEVESTPTPEVEVESTPEQTPETESEKTSTPTQSSTPICPAGTNDHDDNGWGWDPSLDNGRGAGCKIA